MPKLFTMACQIIEELAGKKLLTYQLQKCLNITPPAPKAAAVPIQFISTITSGIRQQLTYLTQTF
ncbi:hypothetical protein B7P43_G10385 [Cryptotermes secundus]|uniref:Uncharacterized protein n=1 Tax=Cryptotermes secundus TaxID=105785 RepID=A0A2J7Q337_9NEOP|nr:hypothetical protein B7P43_G10385 [Cryptotermes secundus]